MDNNAVTQLCSVLNKHAQCVSIDDLKLLNLIVQVDVLPSLQKPKKITIRGSDGNSYTMMCKPKVSQEINVFVLPAMALHCSVYYGESYNQSRREC